MESKQMSPVERVRQERARREEESFGILIKQLGHENMSYKIRAADALGRAGDPRAVSSLAGYLDKDQEIEFLYVLMISLGKIGSEDSVPALLPFLESNDRWTVLGATKALGMIGDASAVGPMAPLLNHSNSDVRVSAVKAIGNIPGDESMKYLHPMLSDEDPKVREAARSAVQSMEAMAC